MNQDLDRQIELLVEAHGWTVVAESLAFLAGKGSRRYVEGTPENDYLSRLAAHFTDAQTAGVEQ